MKLSDILILNKLGTRKQVKKLIKKQMIRVNDVITREDREIDDETVRYKSRILDTHPLKYIILNKPVGYVCDATSAQSVDQLIPESLSYVGRLDRDTSGLLLLTNDYKLRKKLILPDFHIPKTYYFTCRDPLIKNQMEMFKQGIIIDGHVRCRPARIKMISETAGELTIDEGKYHEIRKMFMSLNNEIITLKRIRFASLSLDGLEEGVYRHLSEEEISSLKEAVKHDL